MQSLLKQAEAHFLDFPIANTEHHLNRLLNKIDWYHPIYRGGSKSPRGVCSMGMPYSYSGIVVPATDWDKAIYQLMLRINELLGTNFNACLLNHYPANTYSSIAKHSDLEKELGPNPLVVSVSLGTSCKFILQNKKDKSDTVSVDLKDGSVFLMGDKCQLNYWHFINRTFFNSDRISLTFRCFV